MEVANTYSVAIAAVISQSVIRRSPQAKIDAHQLDEAATTEQEQQHQAYVARILQIVQPEV